MVLKVNSAALSLHMFILFCVARSHFHVQLSMLHHFKALELPLGPQTSPEEGRLLLCNESSFVCAKKQTSPEATTATWHIHLLLWRHNTTDPMVCIPCLCFFIHKCG
jgi:hypothetical protein